MQSVHRCIKPWQCFMNIHSLKPTYGNIQLRKKCAEKTLPSTCMPCKLECYPHWVAAKFPLRADWHAKTKKENIHSNNSQKKKKQLRYKYIRVQNILKRKTSSKIWSCTSDRQRFYKPMSKAH